MINVNEILDKHGAYWVNKMEDRKSIDVKAAKLAMKEILDLVFTRITEEVALKGMTYNAKTKQYKDITKDIGGDCYWESHPEDQPYPDLQIEIDKESILNVKNQINYEH